MYMRFLLLPIWCHPMYLHIFAHVQSCLPRGL